MFEHDTHFVETLKVASYPKAQNHVIFLDEVISDSSYYRNAILTLKTASPDDSVTIIHNTEGGLAHTASVFVSAMNECQAHITGELCGLVASAGTKIALSCDDWMVGEDVVFMCHTSSYGAGNSAEKLRDQVKFMDEWVSKMNKDTYEGFLTEGEITLMSENGKEYWFGADELKERLQRFAEHRVSKQQSAMEDIFSQQNEQSDKYENLLLKTLVEQGKISQEEADIALRVRDATVILDEEEGESLFETLSCKDEDCCDEGKVLCQFSPESSCRSFEIYGYTIEYVLENESVKNILIIDEPTALLVDEIDLPDAKALAEEWGIKYPHNIKEENLIKKVIKYFEDLVLDHVTQ